MSKGKFNLVCVAHPDDETIFFGGLIQRRSKLPWMVVCVTDGNADGMGELRKKQFKKACGKLGVNETQWWRYPDRYEDRLPIDQLIERLKALPTPHEIFTHGVIGEYGHPHHQDVSYSVHQAFVDHPRVYAVAYNVFPEIRIHLTEEEYAIKGKILTEIYGSETTRFLNLLPSTSTEGYLRLTLKEVAALYDYLARKEPLRAKHLSHYRWLMNFLRQKREMPRPF